ARRHRADRVDRGRLRRGARAPRRAAGRDAGRRGIACSRGGCCSRWGTPPNPRPRPRRMKGDRLRFVSHFPGRLRVRATTFRVLPDVADGVAQRLREEPGVSSVEVARVTGSILVHYDPRVVEMPRLAQLLVRLGGLHGLEVDAGDAESPGGP